MKSSAPKKVLHRQRGVAMMEYVTAVCILLPIFLAAGIFLQKAIKARTLASRSAVQHMTPKSTGLSQLRDQSQAESGLDNTAYDEH